MGCCWPRRSRKGSVATWPHLTLTLTPTRTRTRTRTRTLTLTPTLTPTSTPTLTLTLTSTLAQIGGKFAKAATTWIDVLNDPSGGVEATTEVEVSGLSGDAEKLASMCDALLLENEMLQRFAASLDVESLAEVHSRSPALGLMSSLLSHCLVIVSQAVQGARHGWHRLH